MLTEYELISFISYSYSDNRVWINYFYILLWRQSINY